MIAESSREKVILQQINPNVLLYGEQVFFIIALTQSTSHTKQKLVSDSIL